MIRYNSALCGLIPVTVAETYDLFVRPEKREFMAYCENGVVLGGDFEITSTIDITFTMVEYRIFLNLTNLDLNGHSVIVFGREFTGPELVRPIEVRCVYNGDAWDTYETVGNITSANYGGVKDYSIHESVSMSDVAEDPISIAYRELDTASVLINNGDEIVVKAVFQRGEYDSDRGFYLTIGNDVFDESLVIITGEFPSTEDTDEKYLIEAHIVKVNQNDVLYWSSIKAIGTSPVEEELTSPTTVTFAIPSTARIAFWGADANNASISLLWAGIYIYTT